MAVPIPATPMSVDAIPKSEAHAFAAAAQAGATAPVVVPRTPSESSASEVPAAGSRPATAPTALPANESAPVVATKQAELPRATASAPVFSAALEPSQSWFSKNKYVLGALLLVAAVVSVIYFLR